MHTLSTFKKIAASLLFVLSLIVCGTARAQGVYGNEWINYSQTYYKIKVTNTGLHRLSYGYLDSLGLANANPKQFQLFRRGKEVAIYVAGEEDRKLDPQDYVEFYGERNDGALDSELYKDPKNQVHQLFSLYTDTAAYFLTLNPIGGKRMQELNPSASGLTPEPYHLQKAVYANADRFNYGNLYDITNKQIRMPWLDEGEGYFSNYSINPRQYVISGITNIMPTGPKPRVEYATVGVSEVQHFLDLNVLPPNSTTRLLNSFEYTRSGFARGASELEFTDISSSGSVTLQVFPKLNPDYPNSVSFAYGIVTYPQKNVFQGNCMFVYTDTLRAPTQYFEFTGAPSATVAYDVTNPFQPTRILGSVLSDGKGFVVNAGPASHKVLLANTIKAYKPVLRGEAVKFRLIDPNQHNYIIVTNKRLMKKVEGEMLSPPLAFAAYRASPAGGSYDTLVMTMDQIVNEFHYGEFSSNSVRRLMKFMQTSPRSKHLFIIGKGLMYAADDYRLINGRRSFYEIQARNPKVYELDLVPTGIVPASDIFFTADFRSNSYAPQVPTGRLAVTSPEQIISYLNKVKEYEALPPVEPWRKNILQLGGGKTTYEINTFAGYLSRMKQIAVGPLLGANVIEKYRQNVSEAVETVDVKSEINSGVSLVTFFGHSSSTVSDIDIGQASVAVNGYHNKGKYPVILMNGCGAGNAFVPNNVSFGEDWLQTAEKGAVAMIAHVDAGYPDVLNLYSNNFYAVAFQDPEFYGKTIGLVQQETIKRTVSANQSNAAVAMVMEMTLQGDPALKLYSPEKPDYSFTPNTFSIASDEDKTVTASTKKFNIKVGVQNPGKAVPDSLYIKVRRTLADNTIVEYDSIKIAPVYNNASIVLPVSNDGVAALGMNTFDIYLDSPNAIDEFSEDNNIGHFQHYFPASGLVALAPAEYGVINTSTVKLLAQATQVQTNQQGYYFELDTTQAFNSNLKILRTIENSLLPEWEVTLPGSADSTVYFWRARFKTYEAGEDTAWAASSFRYIKTGSEGWSQSHRGQFNKTEVEQVQLLQQSDNAQWEFSPLVAEVEIKAAGGDERYKLSRYNLYFNGKPLISDQCENPDASALPRLYVALVKSTELTLVEKFNSSVSCNPFSYVYQFGDISKAANQLKLENFLKSVPEGYYVLIGSVNKVPFEAFSASLKNEFKNIGSGLIDQLKNGYPYGIVGQKGAAPGTAREMTASSQDPATPTAQAIALRVILKSNQPTGTLTSTPVGPALSWGSLFHNIERYKGGDDKYKLDIIGVTLAGNEQVLTENVPTKRFDLSSVDAKQFPFLRLRAQLTDSTARTAPQLKEWMVYYEPTPEGVIRPDLAGVNDQMLTEQANRGSINMPMAFQNISNSAFKDSLTVEVTFSGDGVQPKVSRFKIKPVAAHETVNFSYSMPTATLDGSYKLSMVVNPRLLPEQEYFNNIYEGFFRVKPRLHPIMDVAFDGIHILDGELVSPTPLISVVVKDENQGAFLQDPATMSIILIDPETKEQEVSLANNPNEVKFYPADEKNDFRLEYKPAKLVDGKYTMEVRAKDAAGKASGISPYRIGFEVVSESSITNFYPYPNPFSSKTQFIFTITGSTIPEHMKIQVMTVTGKVVKEIMKEEMGPLRIGNNKTEYAWDGTDMYGDKLANGVYLYRVVMSQTEEDMKHRNTFGQKAFKNGYGKLYILR